MGGGVPELGVIRPEPVGSDESRCRVFGSIGRALPFPSRGDEGFIFPSTIVFVDSFRGTKGRPELCKGWTIPLPSTLGKGESRFMDCTDDALC